jgi:hypothetical protein
MKALIVSEVLSIIAIKRKDSWKLKSLKSANENL